MAVTRKPKPAPVSTPDPSAFIAAAEEAANPPPTNASNRKVRVVLHFDADILAALDREVDHRREASRGLEISRGSVVRELTVRHIMEA